MPIIRPVTESKGNLLFDGNMPIFVNRNAESFDIPLHRHDFVEIAYVGEGAGFHYIGEELLPVTRGDLFFIPIGTPHVFRPSSAQPDRRLVVYNCVFSKETLLDWMRSLPVAPLAEHVLGGGADSPFAGWRQFREKGAEFGALFKALYAEYANRSAGCETMLLSSVMQLLVLLHRHDRSLLAASAGSRSPLDDALDYIDRNIHMPITLEQISALTGLGKRQFYRLFKARTKQTFLEYIQNARIEQSCRLLRSTPGRIHEIAGAVGYQDMKFFNRLFKKKTGVTPRQYRANT